MITTRHIAALGIGVVLAFAAWPQTAGPAARKKSSAGKKKSAGKKSAGKRSTASAKGTKAKRQSWRAGQMAPTPDRYRQVQEALVQKGFSTDPPSGVWGPEWSQSLKNFQQAQNLEVTGKLDSLSLITLGLGPKREAATVPNPTPPKENP